VPRNNPAATLPTDFALVRCFDLLPPRRLFTTPLTLWPAPQVTLPDGDAGVKARAALSDGAVDVKDVHPERKLTRQLRFMQSDSTLASEEKSQQGRRLTRPSI